MIMPEIYKRADKTKESNTGELISSEKHRNGSLSAYMVRPKNVRFETQEQGEEIVLLLRQHPVVNLGWFLAIIVMLTAPFIAAPFILQGNFIPSDIPIGYMLVLPLLWYLGVLGYTFANFLHWYFNVYIVTNLRVVDIDWVGLLYKEFSATQLGRIQDITYKQGGLLDTFFDFGTIYIQTAGAEPNFEFEDVPMPNQVVKQINELLEKQDNKTPVTKTL